MMDFQLCSEIEVTATIERDEFEPNEWDVEHFELLGVTITRSNPLWPALMQQVESARDEISIEWQRNVRRVRVLE